MNADYWTPEQALAVYDLLNNLAEAVWNRYEIALIELLAPEPDDARAGYRCRHSRRKVAAGGDAVRASGGDAVAVGGAAGKVEGR
jgi:hypothetical protein